MKQVTITIRTEGAAFETFLDSGEVCNILHALAFEFENKGRAISQTIRDRNGIVCGTVVIECEPGEM